MSYIVLSEIKLNLSDEISHETKVVLINNNSVTKFENDSNVIAVVGSRAMANIVLNMNLPSLKLYQLTSAGFDTIPIEAFRNKGVYLCNAGDVYSTPIAETIIYGMLQYEKKYWKNPKYHFLRPMRKYKYIGELSGKKLLIMGCGRIGASVAKRALSFDMELYGYDCNNQNKPEYRKIYTSREELMPNLREFDYIVTTIPLFDETKEFLNMELFDAMGNNAVIVNIGRRGIFNEKDLYKALKQRKIKGAVLDMFEKVPNPITNPFRRLSNVIVMPGVSAISKEVKDRLHECVTENCASVIAGKEPKFRIV